MTDYTIEDIKKILKKIENMKERKHIERIKSIIFKENPNLSFTKKTSGVLLFFHNLSQSTYKKLDLYFDKIDNDKIEKATSYSESINLSNSDTDNNINTNDLEHKIKLSNTEKKILKKKEYHKQIYSDSKVDDIYVNDEIFYNKNKN
jgi:hypothetical protein